MATIGRRRRVVAVRHEIAIGGVVSYLRFVAGIMLRLPTIRQRVLSHTTNADKFYQSAEDQSMNGYRQELMADCRRIRDLLSNPENLTSISAGGRSL